MILTFHIWPLGALISKHVLILYWSTHTLSFSLMFQQHYNDLFWVISTFKCFFLLNPWWTIFSVQSHPKMRCMLAANSEKLFIYYDQGLKPQSKNYTWTKQRTEDGFGEVLIHYMVNVLADMLWYQTSNNVWRFQRLSKRTKIRQIGDTDWS